MRYKKAIGFILIFILVISNVFNYNTSAKYRTEFELVTESIMAKDSESIEILVSHIDMETNEKLVEDEIIAKRSDEEVIGAHFKKEIEEYSFKEAIPEKIIVSLENKEIKLYYEKNEVIPEEKYADVTIHHYLIDSTESVIEDEILKKVKIGAVLTASDYIKQVEGYKFSSSLPQTLKVSEEEKEIIIYYKKVEVIEPIEYVDVNIYFYDKDNKEISVAEKIEKVKIGENLKGRDYIREIEWYDFKYSFPEILEVREDNTVIKLYYRKNEEPTEEQFINVIINHFIIGTDTKIADSDILENIKVGTVILSKDHIKTIEGYDFDKSLIESLEVSKENSSINIYYKKKDTSKPIEPEKPGDFEKPEDTNKPSDTENPGINQDGGNKGKKLPETGGRNIIWLGYIIVLLGIIINSNKKEDYAE